MIRHKATGKTMVWRPTTDCHGGRRLTPADDDSFDSTIAYWYPPPMKSSLWVSGCESLGAQTSPQTLEALLVNRGIIEVFDDPSDFAVIEEDPPKDYDAIHRAGEAGRRSIYIEALATVAAHDQSPLSIRVAAIDELRRLALEER